VGVPSARLHRVPSKDISYQLRAHRLLSGDIISSEEDAAKHLLLINCQPIGDQQNSERVWYDPAQEDWDLALKVVSESKVRWAIDGFGTSKVAEENGIYHGLVLHEIEIIIKLNTKVLHVWSIVTFRLRGG
jgi:hypothetical protein